MKNNLLFLFLCLLGLNASGKDGRETISLSGDGWWLWRDKEASWQNDQLYLPNEITDLALLPVNEPTGGWNVLTDKIGAVPVSVPGTVEEYLTRSDNPRPEHFTGVSWWFRDLDIPADLKDKRFILHFESVRMRAEVYIDGQLVAYDVIGESPFHADITSAITPGKTHRLAVRVTNPGGNFHWQDFDIQKWGDYLIPPGRGFGGIIGRVVLEAVAPVYISDIYIQNTPKITAINVIASVSNLTADTQRDVEFIVREKKNPSRIVFTKKLSQVSIPKGESEVKLSMDVPEAKRWDLQTPDLYVCEVALFNKKQLLDKKADTFGFRWFAPDGIGENAVLRLNGRRIMLRSAISWGYFPVTGLIATPEMAEKQIKTAQELGLNMLNFHRCIGSPVVLEKADELGLLYFEEPGSFHSANHDPFIRAIVNEKLKRMVRRDRNHPSLVIYNLINEYGGVLARDKELVTKRMNDMREAHAVDPSRVMTFTSGWAGNEFSEEDSKSHLRPYDTTLYRKGWYDNHRAGGPETWMESYYKAPDKNIMYTTNKTEVYVRGEEAAISTPPRIQKIGETIAQTHLTGWDGLFWLKQQEAFQKFFEAKNLKPYFGNIDALTRAMGNVSLEHQGRRIQEMRMQNLGDMYVINGWEAMPYDNHSGIVDIYRNPKGDASLLAYYNQPLYIAVASRNQIIKLPGKIAVDFYAVNEADLKGKHILQIKVVSPAGKTVLSEDKEVVLQGGEVFGELLLENYPVALASEGGKYKIEAQLINLEKELKAKGVDEVWGVDLSGELMAGQGSNYGNAHDKLSNYYQETTGKKLESFSPEMKNLDWITVTRPSLDAPRLIEPANFKNLTVSFYKDDDMKVLGATKEETKIDRNFTEGAQPDTSIPANQSFTIVWRGQIIPPESGQYSIGVSTNRGVRLSINGQRLVDEWYNDKEALLQHFFNFEAGKPVTVELTYRQTRRNGQIQLAWSLPSATMIDPQLLLNKVKEEGTTLLLLESVESWMEVILKNTDIRYNGYYTVGKDWIGGIHYAKEHPLLKGLPVNDALNWQYQAVVREGDRRVGLRITGEELVVGSYRSSPFELGTSVGIIPCGKGKIIFSTLDIVGNLDQPDGPAETARKLLCNFIDYAVESKNNH
jgi:hypothetical protein